MGIGAVDRLEELTRDSVPKIVVVDDEPVHNLLLGEILQQAGYDTRTCESAAQALVEVARGCDCLITDYHMPSMNGAQLIRSVRSMGSSLCIVLTGSDGDGVEKDAIEAGAVTVLRKPTPAELLLRMLEAALRERRGTAATPAKAGPQLQIDSQKTRIVPRSCTSLPQVADPRELI